MPFKIPDAGIWRVLLFSTQHSVLTKHFEYNSTETPNLIYLSIATDSKSENKSIILVYIYK